MQSRLRSWVALGQFRDGLPDSLLHAFVPPASLERADADHARWGSAETGVAAADPHRHLVVPLPWFVPFAPGDRVAPRTHRTLARRGPPDPDVGRPAPGGPGAAHAAAEPGRRWTIADELEELGRWLEEFHARSWVELDYAGLARLLGPEVVAADTSVADVAAAVAALAAGDEEGAVLHLPHRRGPLVGGRGPRARQLERAAALDVGPHGRSG